MNEESRFYATEIEYLNNKYLLLRRNEHESTYLFWPVSRDILPVVLGNTTPNIIFLDKTLTIRLVDSKITLASTAAALKLRIYTYNPRRNTGTARSADTLLANADMNALNKTNN